MSTTTRIEIDELPLSMTLTGRPDYSARQVMSAAFSPLFRVNEYGQVQASEIVREYEFDSDENEILITLDERAAWSDGKRVSNLDVARTLKSAAKSKFWGHHLVGLRRIELIGDDEISLRTKWGTDHFSRLMSAIELSPSRKGVRLDRGPFSGPFKLQFGSSQIEGIPNERSLKTPVAGVTFLKNSNPEESLSMYYSDQIDVTCNTGVSMRNLENLRSHPDYCCKATGIYMHIEFANKNHPWLSDPNVRRFLSSAVERQALFIQLSQAFAITEAFEYASAAKCDVSVPSRINSTPLTLGYHPYPPNKQVADFVADCWRKHGIQTQLSCTRFGTPDPVSDLHLRLRFDSYPHWYSAVAHYMAQLCQLNPDLLNTLSTICTRALDAEQKHCPAKLEEFFFEFMPVIPLLRIDGHWLQRPTVAGYSVTENASFDFSELGRATE